MNSLKKFLEENGYILHILQDNLIVASSDRFKTVRIEKNRNDMYVLKSEFVQYKSNKFTDIRLFILNKIMN